MIYTIGYQGWEQSQVVEVVNERDAVLMDVRFKPFSRQPGFHKSSLAKALGDKYIHAEGLGNLNYKGGPVKLLNPDPWIARIGVLHQERSVILMCGCWNHLTCHRTDVAKMIQRELGLEFEHLPKPPRIPKPRASSAPSLF